MSANGLSVVLTGSVLAGIVMFGGQSEKPNVRNGNWRLYMRTMKANSEALKDQWDKPTKHKGHWQKDTMRQWAHRSGYQSIDGYKANSAAALLAGSLARSEQK